MIHNGGELVWNPSEVFHALEYSLEFKYCSNPLTFLQKSIPFQQGSNVWKSIRDELGQEWREFSWWEPLGLFEDWKFG